MEIKPTAQGVFYPEETNELINIFNGYYSEKAPASNLVIVPHAGYEFSGKIAYETISRLTPLKENIIIIAPALYNKIYGSATCNEESFSTPLGSVKIKPAENIDVNNELFKSESAITVQIPIIKNLFPECSVTPVLYGCEDYKNITGLIRQNFEKSSFIIATNLSRFIPERESLKLDEQTARMIERKQIQDLDIEMADGAVGVCAAIEFAKENNMNFVQTALTNSSQITGDSSSVVGYGGWYLI